MDVSKCDKGEVAETVNANKRQKYITTDELRNDLQLYTFFENRKLEMVFGSPLSVFLLLLPPKLSKLCPELKLLSF